MLTKMAISAVVSLKMLKVRIFTEFFYQCTSLRSFLFLFFEKFAQKVHQESKKLT